MALTSAVRVPLSHRTGGFDFVNSVRGLSAAWAAFMTMLVAGPWLAPGYIFGTDWPGPRRFDFPSSLYSSAPLEAALAVGSRAVGGELTGKLLILTAIFIAGATSYKALPIDGFVPKATAATIYVINPFVYGRLHYGQLFLLAGYALVPWAGFRLRRLLIEPGVSTALMAAFSFALIGILSLHLFLAGAVLAATAALAYTISAIGRSSYLTKLIPSLFLALLATFVASAFWVLPLLMGRGTEGTTVAGIRSSDLIAFAAVPDRQLGLAPNLLGLYGFWAENTGRFASMKAFVPFWPTLLATLLAVCAIGAIAAFRQPRSGLRPWVAGLLMAGALGLLLEMGMSSPLTAGVVNWVAGQFPIYRGMRDAGKWGALLALVYSQLGGLGAVAILMWLKKGIRGPARAEWAGGIAAALLLAVPLYYGNGLLFGAHGEIKPSQYPAGWYAADRALLADAHPGRTLFLPWHEYMPYSFIQNQNSVVASPAPNFFSVPILASLNPEVPGIAPPSAPDQVAVGALVNEGSGGSWAEVLASLDVKYVLVARELDWRSYAYLDSQPGLSRVADLGQILIYRNNLANSCGSLNQTNLYVKLTVGARGDRHAQRASFEARWWFDLGWVRPGCLRILKSRRRFHYLEELRAL